jgi:hypothetical protein
VLRIVCQYLYVCFVCNTLIAQWRWNFETLCSKCSRKMKPLVTGGGYSSSSCILHGFRLRDLFMSHYIWEVFWGVILGIVSHVFHN